MKLSKSKIERMHLSSIPRLDPVTVYAEDFSYGQGQITIICYGQSWTAYWGGMGDRPLKSFFVSCDEHYIANKLSSISSTMYDIDKLREDAGEKGIACYRDDPWNDYEFMNDMYGPDVMDWTDSLPKKTNHEYTYLCRIIKVVQDAFKSEIEND